jgi:general secretion pathway protein N
LPPVGNRADLPQPQPLQQFALIWQKPLFTPDRKPVAYAADGGSNLGDLELTGIILTPGLRMALLHDKNGDTQVRLHEGESLPDGSVTLVELHPRSALFDSSAGRTELKLPAGAPIDEPGPGGSDAREPRNAAAGNAMMRVQAGGEGAQKMDVRPAGGNPMQPMRRNVPAQQAPPERPAGSAVERLRQSIQKRRAAHAAAANEGVR